MLVVQNGWRVEAEASYYTGREGFDVLMVYGETFWRSATRQTLYRDQHLALLGEYRLFVVRMDERLQFAPGLGLSLRRLNYYSEDVKAHEPLYLAVDAEIAGIFFASDHFMLRSQATYSFAPRYPLYGTISITLRLGYRS